VRFCDSRRLGTYSEAYQKSKGVPVLFFKTMISKPSSSRLALQQQNSIFVDREGTSKSWRTSRNTADIPPFTPVPTPRVEILIIVKSCEKGGKLW